MALRQILTEPNKILREKSSLVEKVDENLQKLMDDMLETMYAAPGIGLAAIHVGVHKRVIVLDIAQKDGPKNPMFFDFAIFVDSQSCMNSFEEFWFFLITAEIQGDVFQFVERRPQVGAIALAIGFLNAQYWI